VPGTPKTVTLAREVDGWYACCSRAEVPSRLLSATGTETGSDAGPTVVLRTAAGRGVENPRHVRTAEQALRRTDRRVARRRQGSHRRGASRPSRCAPGSTGGGEAPAGSGGSGGSARTTTTRPRSGWRADDAIDLDDVRVANLVRNPHLSTRLADAGRAAVRTLREAQVAWARRRVLAVPPADTGQDGSGRGERVPTALRVPTGVCPHRGLVLDRDANAAQHLVRAGQARRGAVAVAASKREAPFL
jgi:putative transposase